MCEDCKNYEKKEEKIKWEGIVEWQSADGPDGHAVCPLSVTGGSFQGALSSRLIGKKTKMTIEEI